VRSLPYRLLIVALLKFRLLGIYGAQLLAKNLPYLGKYVELTSAQDLAT
jgi:hypothetical protein